MQCNLPAISVSGGGIPSGEEVGNDSCTTVDANLSHEKLHIPLNGIEAQAKGMSYSYQLQVKLTDGRVHVANFKFK